MSKTGNNLAAPRRRSRGKQANGAAAAATATAVRIEIRADALSPISPQWLKENYELLRQMREVEMLLAPEKLSADGRRTAKEIRARRQVLSKHRASLLKRLGRDVDVFSEPVGGYLKQRLGCNEAPAVPPPRAQRALRP